MIEFVKGRIWVDEYPVTYAGLDFLARMTVIRLDDGRVMLHSPGPVSDESRQVIEAIGEVAYILAPGSFHYFHVAVAQKTWPQAKTWICPGVEQKVPQLRFDHFLSDAAPDAWGEEFEQVLVRGSRIITEVAMFHKPSRTLMLVDLIENIGDETPGAGLGIKLWWKLVFHMWNTPKPAPEYQLGWKDKKAARESLERILAWDFERVIIAHGDLISENARAVAREAWKTPLAFEDS